MLNPAAETLLYGFFGYAALGVVFALVFVFRGVQKLDVVAHGAGIGFRLLILPGVAAVWPLFLNRWVSKMNEFPTEKKPHRIS